MVAIGVVILLLISLGGIAYTIYMELISGNIICGIAILGLILLIAGILLAIPVDTKKRKFDEDGNVV